MFRSKGHPQGATLSLLKQVKKFYVCASVGILLNNSTIWTVQQQESKIDFKVSKFKHKCIRKTDAKNRILHGGESLDCDLVGDNKFYSRFTSSGMCHYASGFFFPTFRRCEMIYSSSNVDVVSTNLLGPLKPKR